MFVPDIERRSLTAPWGQAYEISVAQPLRRRGLAERFPVLYLTDADLFWGMAASVGHALQAANEVERFILVGIGAGGGNPFAGMAVRRRDFTSRWRPTPSEPVADLAIEGVVPLSGDGPAWGQADRFLAFLKDMVMPLVDRDFPTTAGERAYAGHSLGAGLGLHALLEHPGLFERYILASPSVAWDDNDYGLRRAEAVVLGGRRLDARLFLAAGGLEDDDPDPGVARARFTSNFHRLAAILAPVPGLRMTARLFAEETHMGVWPAAFGPGLRTVFGEGVRG